MKEYNLKIPFLFLILLIIIGCKNIPLGKEDYIKKFTRFVTKVELIEDPIKEEDWKKFDADFKNYSTVYYDRYKSAFTEKEKDYVNQLIGKYKGIRFKKSTEESLKQFKEEFDELINRIKGFFED